MNKQNYGNLELCKKLFDAGIVLETDLYWCKMNGVDHTLISSEERESEYPSAIPAPTMAEVWREFPWFVLRGGENRQLQIEKYSGVSVAYYDGAGPNISDKNPTDALIQLLIWVKENDK